MTNFALADAVGIAAAFFLFSILAFFPGYAVGYGVNLWRFRTRTLAFQVAASVPLSLGIGPIFTFLVGNVSGWGGVWILYGSATVVSLCILVRTKPPVDRTVGNAFLVGLVWSVLGSAWLMDWQAGGRVYFPIYGFDYSTRSAFIHSLAVFGLPARNPLFNPGHAVALHYHFLFFLQCALVHWLAPLLITARLALIAGALWCGIGLMCVAALSMRLLMQRRSWMAVGLLTVTGLDVVPALVLLIANRMHWVSTLPPSVEWWNDQVDGFIYTTLWEPHYICALIACIAGLLIVWQSRRLGDSLPAAFCFATAVGSGSFVALVFALFLGVWMVLNFRQARILAVTGVLTFVLSTPYLATLRTPAANVGGPSLLALGVRQFSPVPLPAMLRLICLPVNYFLELGFFGVCVLVGYRRKLRGPERMLVMMIITGMVICTFVRSSATPNNDLGWRGFLVAQFGLLILSAAYLERFGATRLLKVMLVMGVVGTGYDLLLARFFPILSDMNAVPKLAWLSSDEKLGERTRSQREAYLWLRQNSPQDAVIGVNPDVASVDVASGLYGDRLIMTGDRTCTIGFGGNAAECAPIYALVARLYQGNADYGSTCRAFNARFYIVHDTDPVWRRRDSWTWTRVPLFANSFVRIFDCR